MVSADVPMCIVMYHDRDDHAAIRDFQVATHPDSVDDSAAEVIRRCGWINGEDPPPDSERRSLFRVRSSLVEPTIYEAMGGADAVLALAEAWHGRCLADPILAHHFAGEIHPQHTERLAAYWSEQLGGPARYTESLGD